MCELSVYMTDKDECIMEGVVKLLVDGDRIKLEDIIGISKEITGKIKEINITTQKAFVNPI